MVCEEYDIKQEAVLECYDFDPNPSPMLAGLAASLSQHYDDQCCASTRFMYINIFVDLCLSSQTSRQYTKQSYTTADIS
jgi:hypothetical protein